MKPRKLNLRQIHNLYLTLRHALGEVEQTYLIDELEGIFRRAEPGTIWKALEIMYSKPNPKSGLEGTRMFVEGIKVNEFFSYVEFLKSLNGRSKPSNIRRPN